MKSIIFQSFLDTCVQSYIFGTNPALRYVLVLCFIHHETNYRVSQKKVLFRNVVQFPLREVYAVKSWIFWGDEYIYTIIGVRAKLKKYLFSTSIASLEK